MKPKVSRFCKKGLDEQLAGEIQQCIEIGEFSGSSRLPGSRALAERYDTSLNTIQKSLRLLQSRRILSLLPNSRGYRITKDYRLGGNQLFNKELAVIWGHALRSNRNVQVYGQGFSPTSVWASSICNSFVEASTARDFNVNVMYTSPNITTFTDSLIHRAGGKGVTGVLLFAGKSPILADTTQKLDDLGIVWVYVNRPSESSTQNFVTVDNLDAGSLIGLYCAKIGFKRTVFLGQRPELFPNTMSKMLGFLQGYFKAGVPVPEFSYLETPSNQLKDGCEVVTDYLKNNDAPEVIFCDGDYLALGALRACNELSISVPDEVSVVGSTGLEFLDTQGPSLSVVGQPMLEMGRSAADMIVQMLESGNKRVERRLLKCELVFRESLKIDKDVIKDLREEVGGSRIVCQHEYTQEEQISSSSKTLS